MKISLYLDNPQYCTYLSRGLRNLQTYVLPRGRSSENGHIFAPELAVGPVVVAVHDLSAKILEVGNVRERRDGVVSVADEYGLEQV